MADNTRIFKTSKTSKAGLMLEDGAASLVGDKRRFITVDDRGITLRGPISIVATTESVRHGGMFVGINDFLEMIPSTIISPVPRNISVPPVYMLVNIVKDLSYFMALLI